jgi:hypothetical protein
LNKKQPGLEESKRCIRLREAVGFVGRGQSSFADFIGVSPERWHNVESLSLSSSL